MTSQAERIANISQYGSDHDRHIMVSKEKGFIGGGLITPTAAQFASVQLLALNAPFYLDKITMETDGAFLFHAGLYNTPLTTSVGHAQRTNLGVTGDTDCPLVKTDDTVGAVTLTGNLAVFSSANVSDKTREIFFNTPIYVPKGSGIAIASQQANDPISFLFYGYKA